MHDMSYFDAMYGGNTRYLEKEMHSFKNSGKQHTDPWLLFNKKTAGRMPDFPNQDFGKKMGFRWTISREIFTLPSTHKPH